MTRFVSQQESLLVAPRPSQCRRVLRQNTYSYRMVQLESRLGMTAMPRPCIAAPTLLDLVSLEYASIELLIVAWHDSFHQDNDCLVLALAAWPALRLSQVTTAARRMQIMSYHQPIDQSKTTRRTRSFYFLHQSWAHHGTAGRQPLSSPFCPSAISAQTWPRTGQIR